VQPVRPTATENTNSQDLGIAEYLITQL
jgi:hypothetical protein